MYNHRVNDENIKKHNTLTKCLKPTVYTNTFENCSTGLSQFMVYVTIVVLDDHFKKL